MNRKMQMAYTSYLKSDKYNLYHAYQSFSKAKADAWEYCEKLCRKHEGKGLKVIGACTNFFSAGFLYEENGVKKFMYITHGGDYSAEVE